MDLCCLILVPLHACSCAYFELPCSSFQIGCVLVYRRRPMVVVAFFRRVDCQGILYAVTYHAAILGKCLAIRLTICRSSTYVWSTIKTGWSTGKLCLRESDLTVFCGWLGIDSMLRMLPSIQWESCCLFWLPSCATGSPCLRCCRPPPTALRRTGPLGSPLKLHEETSLPGSSHCS